MTRELAMVIKEKHMEDIPKIGRLVPPASVEQVAASCTELQQRIGHVMGAAEAIDPSRSLEMAKDVLEFLRTIDRKLLEGSMAGRKVYERVKALVKCMSSVRLPQQGEGRIVSDILLHYRVSLCDDDTELAQNFEKVRAEYYSDPKDREACFRFGWMLHDCLKAASRRLHNVKLTEVFKKEFESWSYQGKQGCGGESLKRLLKVREMDIAYAEKFLSGPRDALEYLSSGAFDKAVAAAKRYLESNPGDSTAFDVILNACDKIGTDEACFDMFNVSGQAVKWHPNEMTYQKKFVYAAEKCYWAIFRLVRKDNQKDWARIATNGYVQLIEETLAGFDGLTLVSPGSIPYSKIMSVVTASVDHVLRLRVSELCQRVALPYGEFVRKWGIRNFRPEDCQIYVGERRRPSLIAKVVLTLLKCGEFGVDHSEDSFVMKFAKESEKVFSSDPSAYYNRLASLYYHDQDMALSRKYAIALVQCNQSEGWRWCVLARTYPKGSQERADCLSRAKCKEQSQMDALWAEFFGIKDGGVPVSYDAKSEERCQRAEALIVSDAEPHDGIVITRFSDKASGDEMLRVWWKDSARESGTYDFVRVRDVQELEGLVPGSPIVVKTSRVGMRSRVVRVSQRSKGCPWDIYPYLVGLVVAVDVGRHFVKVMYARGKVCSVDSKKIVATQQFVCGDLCRLALFEREGMSSLALDIKSVEKGVAKPDFCREFSGTLERMRGCRDGFVDGVRVSPEVRGKARFGKESEGLAVDFNAREKGDPRWVAITCRTISKNLEVLQ